MSRRPSDPSWSEPSPRPLMAVRQAAMASSMATAVAAWAMWDIAMSPTAPIAFCTLSGALADILGRVCNRNHTQPAACEHGHISHNFVLSSSHSLKGCSLS